MVKQGGCKIRYKRCATCAGQSACRSKAESKKERKRLRIK